MCGFVDTMFRFSFLWIFQKPFDCFTTSSTREITAQMMTPTTTTTTTTTTSTITSLPMDERRKRKKNLPKNEKIEKNYLSRAHRE